MAAPHEPLDPQVHRALLLRIIDRGAGSTPDELAADTGATPDAVAESLRRLESNHGVVLHPGRLAPWVVHPFSLTPTHFWVETDRRGWWAPCIWCALGVAALVGEPVRIHTRLGAEREPVEIEVEGGRVRPPDLVCHFAIPAAQAWDNVHAFCASTLVLADEADVPEWCARHGYEPGDIVPIHTVYELAKAWYGRHLDPDWRKWTTDEAQAIFESVGLRGPRRRVAGRDRRF